MYIQANPYHMFLPHLRNIYTCSLPSVCPSTPASCPQPKTRAFLELTSSTFAVFSVVFACTCNLLNLSPKCAHKTQRCKTHSELTVINLFRHITWPTGVSRTFKVCLSQSYFCSCFFSCAVPLANRIFVGSFLHE